jgi:ATP:ADP antiporter, AAA family
MIDYVGRVFSMRRGETAPASLLFFYLFLVIGGFYMGQSVGDALFLREFPRHLPYVMMGSALLSGPLVLIYIRLSHRVRLEPLIMGMLLFFAFSFALFWWLTRFRGANWVYWLTYIWVQTEGVMGPTMGWTLANYVLTTREARRVFGFIQMGAILGVPFFCFVTADVMHHGHARPVTLILVLGLFMGICALLVKLLFRQARQRLGAVSLAPTAGEGAPKNFGQTLGLIRSTRYLSLLTALIAIGCIVSAILAYQFRLIARVHSGPDAAGLSAFFARFYGYMGLATGIMQLALTAPLLRAFGIRVALFILPIALLGPTTALLVAPTLLAAGILRGTHSLLRYSVDKSSVELLYLPVAPGIKSQVKSFLDTFIYRVADGTAGLLLVFFANVMHFSPGRVSLISLVLLFTWIAIAYGVRREYLNVLRRAIDTRALDPERTVAGVLDSTTTDVLALCLKGGKERQLLYGLSLFEMGRGPGWHHELRGLLEHGSPAVRQRTLRLLDKAGDREVLPQVEKMLGDESLEVRTEALHYLVVHTGRDPLTLLSSATNFPDYCVQGSVVAYLSRIGEPENLPTARLLLQDIISRTGPDGPRARSEAARVLGVIPLPSELHVELLKLLRDESPEVVEQALQSAGKIQSREFLPLVIEKLGERGLANTARATLAQYGERAIGTLQDYLKDPAVPLSIRKQIPPVLARIPSAESGAVLAKCLVQSDPGLRFDVLKALNKLRRKDPALVPTDVDFSDLLDAELMGYCRSFQILAAFDPKASRSSESLDGESLLTRALRERMDHELERIFRLLALIYPPRDLYNAFLGLHSGHAQVRANALEVLEHLLQPDLYRRLANVLDPEVALKGKLDFAERLCGITVDSKADAVRILLYSADCWLCACAIYAVVELRLTDLKGDVQRVPHDGDPIVAETWNWARTRLALGSPA